MYVLDYKATKPLPRVRYLTNVLVALVTANLTADTFTAGSFGPKYEGGGGRLPKMGQRKGGGVIYLK